MRYTEGPLLRQAAGLLYPVLLPVPFFYRKIPKKAYLWMNYSFRVAPRPLLYLLNGTVGAYLWADSSFRVAQGPFSTC